MENRTIDIEDLKRFFSYSETISDFESTLYESGDRLSQEEFKINSVIDEQNRIIASLGNLIVLGFRLCRSIFVQILPVFRLKPPKIGAFNFSHPSKPLGKRHFV